MFWKCWCLKLTLSPYRHPEKCNCGNCQDFLPGNFFFTSPTIKYIEHLNYKPYWVKYQGKVSQGREQFWNYVLLKTELFLSCTETAFFPSNWTFTSLRMSWNYSHPPSCRWWDVPSKYVRSKTLTTSCGEQPTRPCVRAHWLTNSSEMMSWSTSLLIPGIISSQGCVSVLLTYLLLKYL